MNLSASISTQVHMSRGEVEKVLEFLASIPCCSESCWRDKEEGWKGTRRKHGEDVESRATWRSWAHQGRPLRWCCSDLLPWFDGPAWRCRIFRLCWNRFLLLPGPGRRQWRSYHQSCWASAFAAFLETGNLRRLLDRRALGVNSHRPWNTRGIIKGLVALHSLLIYIHTLGNAQWFGADDNEVIKVIYHLNSEKQ